jgi:multiple sugar transport system substrate-binding protein
MITKNGRSNMKNWKVWSLFAMLLLVFSIMVGCTKDNAEPASNDSKDKEDDPATEEPSKDPVTISYWHIFSDGPMKDTMTGLLDEFEAQNPHITVDELGINFWDYWTKLSTAQAGGSGPDLALNDTSTLPARAKSGAILNIDSFIEKDGFNTDVFFPVLTEKMKYEDSFYGLPSDTDVRVLYYNKAHFREAGLDPEKPPTNWAELEEYADVLTKWDSKKLLDRIGFSPSIGNLHMWTLAWGNGGDFWDDEGNPTYTKPENLEALEWIKKMQDKYGVKAMSAFNSQASSLGYSPFIAGKASMVVDVNNLYTDIKRYAPDLEFGVAAIPYEKEPATWSAGFSYELTNNKDDKRAEAAFELLKYLTSKEVQVKIHEVSGSLVSNMEAAKDPQFMEDPIWKLMVEQMDYSRFVEYIDASPSWHANLDPVEQSVVNSGVDPKKALEEAQTAAENAVKNH